MSLGYHRTKGASKLFGRRSEAKKLLPLARAITYLDEIRNGIFVTTEKIDQEIDRCGIPETKKVWKKIRKDILQLSTKLAKSGEVRKFTLLGAYLRSGAILSVLGYGVLYVMAVMNRDVFLMSIASNKVVIWTMVTIIPITFLVIDYFTRLHIKESMLTMGIEDKAKLKRVIDSLLEILAREIKERGVNRKKLAMSLFHDDYKYIEVKKRPGFLRSTYEVLPSDLGNQEG